jgi:hypothetical protein
MASKQEIVVPYDAITSRGGIVGVFVDNNSKAKFVPIVILSQNNNEVAVSGLHVGQKVVVLPPADMSDGTLLN